VNDCKSYRVAVERLSEVVSDHVLCLPADTGYEIHILSDLDGDPLRKSNARETLAFLADVAWRAKMDNDEVRDAVRYVGDIPVDGLPAWQEAALCWLRWGRLSHPLKPEDRIPRRKVSK
jgi:hypothetical protein